MNSIRHIFFLSIIVASCSNSIKSTDSQFQSDSLSSIDSNSTSIVNSINQTEMKFIPKTHLKDTTFIKGNYVLFLRPDGATFESYETDENSVIYEVDSDFGFAISATMDTMSKNKKYKSIKVDISTERYIVIKDCKNCPLIVDRDTINYGLILSRREKEIQISTFVHSGDYLSEVDEYFKIKNNK